MANQGTGVESESPGARRGPLWDAGYGALVALVLSIVPGSPLAGGAVAGARCGGGYLAGLGRGTLAGVLVALPLALLLVPALRVVRWLGVGIDPASPGYDIFLALLTVFFLAYTVGLSAVGGLAGVWLAQHTDWPLDPARWL